MEMLCILCMYCINTKEEKIMVKRCLCRGAASTVADAHTYIRIHNQAADLFFFLGINYKCTYIYVLYSIPYHQSIGPIF